MEIQELIIIGAGPSGLTAGLYGARRGLKPIILEGLVTGGLLAWSDRIENYPAFPEGISGSELARRMKEQAEKAGAKITNGQVTAIKKEDEKKFIVEAGQPYQTKAVIVASGSQPKKLDVPGEAEFIGRGVSYCATCDGPLFRNKTVAVVGSSTIAVKEALLLTGFSRKVMLVHQRESLSANQELAEKLKLQPGVEIVGKSVVLQISGKDKVSGVRLRNSDTGQESSIAVDGVFIFAGFKPSTRFLPSEVKSTAQGYIITNDKMETSVVGLFACGDCRQKSLRQVVTACADGAIAAHSAAEYLVKKF